MDQYEPASAGAFLSRRKVQRCLSRSATNAVRHSATVGQRTGERAGERFGGDSVRTPTLQAHTLRRGTVQVCGALFGRIPELRQRLQGAARIRIGASPIVFRDYLSPVIQSIRAQFPGLNMILRALNQPELIDSLERDELDVVISLIPENLSSSLRSVEIIRLPLILLAPKKSRIKSAKDFCDGPIAEPLISLGPNELICQRFQKVLAKLGVNWLPKIEMDSLDLIERYVEAGYGVGLSVRWPGKKLSSKIRSIELSDFPPLTLGVLYRDGSNPGEKVRHAFLEEVTRQAARFNCLPIPLNK